MSTPAEHYRHTERLIARAAAMADPLDPTGAIRRTLTKARTHLAQAAGDLDRELALLTGDEIPKTTTESGPFGSPPRP